jgi:hypothetical protein
MSEPVALTTVKGGINRLRTKGAASKDALYDLLNGYVTTQKTVKVRPGTYRRASVPGTKGLCSFDESLHVFAASSVAVPAGYTLHLLTHPAGTNEDGSAIDIAEIHFAAPFMGFLYVVAEFEDADFDHGLGSVFHFWLQTGDVWQADTVYKLGDIVTPTVANGRAYQATRLGAAYQSWKKGVERELGDIVEPTVYNDFYYTAVEVIGENPVSGETEPVWPTSDGERVAEDSASNFDGLVGTTPQPDPDAAPNPATQDRYGGGVT